MSGSDEEEWEVEKIVDERFVDDDGNACEVQYRVRWKDFPPGTFSLDSVSLILKFLRRGHMGAHGEP